jgi:hypothetical protein
MVINGPKERIVCGAVQVDDWTKKLDEVLKDHLISQKLGRFAAVLDEHRRQGRTHDEIEAALSLARELLKSGQRTAANNAVFELERLCAVPDASFVKPLLKKAIQFRGRGKAPDELSQEIDRVLNACGRDTQSKSVWKDIQQRRSDLLDALLMRVSRTESLRFEKRFRLSDKSESLSFIIPDRPPTSPNPFIGIRTCCSAEAIQTLVSIMNNPKSAPAARVSAANALLDRGYGRPQQHITGEGSPTL